MINRIEDYEKQGFQGIDVSLEISLFEYGLIWVKNKECTADNEFLFIYGVNGNSENSYNEFQYTTFDSGYMTKKDFAESFYFEDENLKSIESYTGQTKNELIDNFPNSISDIESYHGIENIFGSSYYEGFSIYNDEMIIEKYENELLHGSGIDCDWNIDFKADTNILVCKNSYQVMSEMGYNEGFIDFTIKFDIDKPGEFKLTFQTNSKGYYQINKIDLRTYLNDVFYQNLTEDIKF